MPQNSKLDCVSYADANIPGAHLELPGLVIERQALIATDTVEYTCGVNYAGTWQINSIVIDVFSKILLSFLSLLTLCCNSKITKKSRIEC